VENRSETEMPAPPSTPIILTTLNARYRHAAFGLRCLKANLGELAGHCRIMEFDIHHRPLDIAEAILHHHPAIVGIGVAIWNLEPVTQLLGLLKTLSPQTILVLGGPEAGHAPSTAPWHTPADLIITGEGEVAFRDFCREFLNHRAPLPANKRIIAPPIDLARSNLPYFLYDENDLKNRFTYVEASRGCPYGCSFCLSADDAPIRTVSMEPFLAAMDDLLERGARQFKFVDRTFNLHTATATTILDFFLQRWRPGLFLHFEMIPDRLPLPLKERLIAFPKGGIQLEIGLQTFDSQTQKRIYRSQDNAEAESNLAWLRTHTQVHLHTDLVFGLPGESFASMGRGFDRLLRLQPQEIQVGILKRLHGTKLARQKTSHAMVYNPFPPYEILSNDQIDFATTQRLRRFSRYWDLIGNSGRFPHLIDWLRGTPSPFALFLQLSDWIFATTGQTHQIALPRLFKLAYQGLIEAIKLDPSQAHEILEQDWHASGHGDRHTPLGTWH